mmetsp:Transcript_5928/g.8382  ORF Transcript_5928/g.8382 Transcript_5928/m.8382 type:complete len:450 (-) Transcript_5928:223-1572(-)
MLFYKGCVSYLLLGLLTSSAYNHGVFGDERASSLIHRALDADFDWNITQPSNWSVVFDGDNMQEAISGTYKLSSQKNFIMRLKTGENCEVDATSPNLEAIVVRNKEGIKVLPIDNEADMTNDFKPGSRIFFLQDGITDFLLKIFVQPDKVAWQNNTNIYTAPAEGETSAQLKFCVRLELLLVTGTANSLTLANTTSVTFAETKFAITIDMATGFEITDINTDRAEADDQTANATVSYVTTAALADEVQNPDDITTPNTTLWNKADPTYAIGNGKPLTVLIELTNVPPGGGVQLKEVLSFKLANDGKFNGTAATDMKSFLEGLFFLHNCALKTSTIQNDDNTTSTTTSSVCIVQTMIITDYFDDLDENGDSLPVTVSGEVLFEFTSASEERRLEKRSLQGTASQGEFNLQVGLENNNNVDVNENEESSSYSNRVAASFMALVLGSAVFFM